MRVIRTRLFDDSVKQLRAADPELFEVVAADIGYLLRVKRAAELPQVRWRIAQSAFPDVTGEVRSHIPGHPEFVRTLFAMADDESICVLAVMGDKNTSEGAQGGEWYDRAVPLLDQAWRRACAEFDAGSSS